jgi:hypothetical protein
MGGEALEAAMVEGAKAVGEGSIEQSPMQRLYWISHRDVVMGCFIAKISLSNHYKPLQACGCGEGLYFVERSHPHPSPSGRALTQKKMGSHR